MEIYEKIKTSKNFIAIKIKGFEIKKKESNYIWPKTASTIFFNRLESTFMK